MLSVLCGEGDGRGSNVRGLPLNLCCLFVLTSVAFSYVALSKAIFAIPGFYEKLRPFARRFEVEDLASV
jgi:hypothetical protein